MKEIYIIFLKIAWDNHFYPLLSGKLYQNNQFVKGK